MRRTITACPPRLAIFVMATPPSSRARAARWLASSGTGATGAAVSHALQYGPELRPRRVTVLLDGGELEVEVADDLRVNLTGWARPVFAGRLSEEFEKELHETE